MACALKSSPPNLSLSLLLNDLKWADTGSQILNQCINWCNSALAEDLVWRLLPPSDCSFFMCFLLVRSFVPSGNKERLSKETQGASATAIMMEKKTLCVCCVEGDNGMKGKLLVSISFNLKTPSYLLKVDPFWKNDANHSIHSLWW